MRYIDDDFTGHNISLATFLFLLNAVGCINDLNHIMPEQPESPYLYNDKLQKTQRIRHKKEK